MWSHVQTFALGGIESVICCITLVSLGGKEIAKASNVSNLVLDQQRIIILDGQRDRGGEGCGL